MVKTQEKKDVKQNVNLNIDEKIENYNEKIAEIENSMHILMEKKFRLIGRIDELRTIIQEVVKVKDPDKKPDK